VSASRKPDSSGRIIRRPRVNREALEAARLTLLAHEEIIREVITTEGSGSRPDGLDRVLEAIRRVVDDDVRRAREAGGSR
jgi:hypothetical protein